MAREHLQAAARARSQAAEKRVRQALTEMTRQDAQVNFVAVANQAQVSTDFLYRHPQFRDQITALRQKARGRPTPPTAADDVGEDTN